MGASPWIEELGRSTFAPRRVEVALDRLESAWKEQGLHRDHGSLADRLEAFPLGSSALAWLIASSTISAEKLIHDPRQILWLEEPEICDANRELWQMRVDLARLRDRESGFDPGFRALRVFKGRELLRIALREVCQAAPLEQTALEVSCVADVCVQEVVNAWEHELRRQLGDPESTFCVLGMGKLGGRELNYSSDIDLIFLYSEEGQLTPNFSYHGFFNRLGGHIVRTFSEANPAGSLFRIDMRLRPEGDSGPLTRSVDSAENYYSGYGETWERMAMAKARWIAGDEELGYEVVQRLQPFVYPRYVTPEMIEEVAHTKDRLEREVAGLENRHRDLKNGLGGIREIEFVVQSLQLLHGAHHPFLQQPSTLKALEALRTTALEGTLSAEEITTLRDAYQFLRTVEHRIQIEAERQTHSVPQDTEARRRLALSLKFGDEQDFEAELHVVTTAVRAIFERHFAAERNPPELDLQFFREPERARKLLAEMADGGARANLAPRTRRVFRQFEPALLEALESSVEPDVVLNLFSRFIKAYGNSGTLYELLMEYPRLMELFTGIFDASPVLSEMAIQHPDLIESVARGTNLDEEMTVGGYRDLLRKKSASDGSSALDGVRAFRRYQLFRIVLRDVMGISKVDEVLSEYTALAEACLLHIQELVGAGDSLTIVAQGKFGAGELSFGSDLDLVFVGKDPAAAQELLREYGRISGQGGLDELDTRLRPEGTTGAMVQPVSAFRHYYESGRAQLWEAQALSKVRVISGPDGLKFETFAIQAWARFGSQKHLGRQISDMLQKVYEERTEGDGFVHFKTGRGGLMALEFAVQKHQMQAQLWEPNTLRAASKLRDQGVWDGGTWGRLQTCYRFLRRCSFVLRRYHNKSHSVLPTDQQAMEALGRRMGFSKVEEFRERYSAVRSQGADLVRNLLED